MTETQSKVLEATDHVCGEEPPPRDGGSEDSPVQVPSTSGPECECDQVCEDSVSVETLPCENNETTTGNLWIINRCSKIINSLSPDDANSEDDHDDGGDQCSSSPLCEDPVSHTCDSTDTSSGKL